MSDPSELDALRAELAETRAKAKAFREAVANCDAIEAHERAGKHRYCHGCDLARLLDETSTALRVV